MPSVAAQAQENHNHHEERTRLTLGLSRVPVTGQDARRPDSSRYRAVVSTR
jgi:hypothetical protein